jgi:DNA polymerase IV
MGMNNCADLRTAGEDFLLQTFGSFGSQLYRLCRGIDERPVKTDRLRKSLSVENTYSTDLPSLESCLNELPALHQQMEKRLQSVLHKYRISKKYVKVKFLDFVSTTAEHVADDSTPGSYTQLMTEAWNRGARPVRLLGLGVRLAPLDRHPEVQGAANHSEQLLLPGLAD